MLSIVCPVRDGGEVNGVGIFNANEDETRAIMDGDPGVQAGVFVYELHPTRSFPGDALPADPPLKPLAYPPEGAYCSAVAGSP